MLSCNGKFVIYRGTVSLSAFILEIDVFVDKYTLTILNEVRN